MTKRFSPSLVATSDSGRLDLSLLDSLAAAVATLPVTLTQNFDGETAGGFYTDVNGAGDADHDLINNGGGEAPVDSVVADLGAGTLPFDARYETTRSGTGAVGLTDGDFVGVTSFSGTVGSFTSGAQGYQMSDTDGKMILEFAALNASASGALGVSIDVFVQDTGYESDDSLTVGIDTTGDGAIDRTLAAWGETELEANAGSWMTLTDTVPAGATTAQLIVEVDTNSATEAVYLDSISISGYVAAGPSSFSYTQSFETESGGGEYFDTGNSSVDHDLVNNPGQASVDSESSGIATNGLLAFDASYVDTRNSVGLTDGDFVGVTTFTSVVGAFTDGVKGYQLSDTDGLMRLDFEEVDSSGAGEVSVSLDAFVQETGWESLDQIRIGIATNTDGTAAEQMLLDTAGADIDDLNIEGAWQMLSATVPASVDSFSLFVELDSNSSSEALYIDNIEVSSGLAEPVINEFSVASAGSDIEFYEVLGTANFDLSDYTIVQIDGSTGGNAGEILHAAPLGTTDANGYFVTSFASGTLANGSSSLFLVKDFTGAVSEDLDTNDDGTLETMPWSALTDTVAVDVGGGVTYGGVVLDAAFDDARIDKSVAPKAASRIPDGTDTDSADDWYRNDFDGAGFDTLAGTPEDGEALYTPGAANALAETPATQVLISEIQGTGGDSPLDGLEVQFEGVVVGDYDDDGELNGFFVQEEDIHADADPDTSEGIFVFKGAFSGDVSEGDVVSVTGTVAEFFGQTQVTDVTDITVSDTGRLDLVTAASVDIGAFGSYKDVLSYEPYEGMLVELADTMVVSEYFQLSRYGQIVLTENERPYQFTQMNAPDVAGNAAYQADVLGRQIILDDSNNIQNAYSADDGVIPLPDGGLSVSNFFRGGDSVTGLTGVMSWSFSGQSGTDAWRLRPVEQAPVTFDSENPRPASPEDVGGSLKVASFNILNFFTSIDGTTSSPNGSPRGAHSEAELERQTDKLVAAIEAMDVDILGLVEIENEFTAFGGDGRFALGYLVDALNAEAGAGTYGFIDPGQQTVDSSDVISNAFIYRTATVQQTPGSTVEILNDADLAGLGFSFGNAVFDGVSTNRASLAASFTEVVTGESITIAANHFKSKGSVNPAPGNTDTGDGAGNNNAIRLQAAQAVEAWLESDPTGAGDDRSLILGDLNAYAKEDPVTFLESEGFQDLARRFGGDDAYSYVFDSQLGTLDYAMSNALASRYVSGATDWHINADEVVEFDYNDDILDPAESSFEEEPGGTVLYADDPYRTSDHDPVIIGLQLAPIEVAENARGRSRGTDAVEIFRSEGGRNDRMFSNKDGVTDFFVFGDETYDGFRDRDTIRKFEFAHDVILLEDGASVGSVRDLRGGGVAIRFDGGSDVLYVKGMGVDASNIVIEAEIVDVA